MKSATCSQRRTAKTAKISKLSELGPRLLSELSPSILSELSPGILSELGPSILSELGPSMTTGNRLQVNVSLTYGSHGGDRPGKSYLICLIFSIFPTVFRFFFLL